MVETEVESILREIRERVLSQQNAGQDVAGLPARPAVARVGNGAGDGAVGGTQDSETLAAENLSLINSYLTTTARSWDRLPPLVSNRNGVAARLELWLKRRLKSGTRWFTWEQVNFNAAVHHALRDLLPVFSACEHELRTLQAKINADREARRIEFAQLQAEIAELRAESESLRAELATRLAELVSEVRHRDEQAQDQQRVCFKQLSLETSEAATLEDRARRKTETLLATLQRRIEQLEKM